MVNKSVGRYQVLGLLSKSGTNQVFLGRALEGGEVDYHAVRWIQDSAFEDARRAAWLRHPNLASVRELGADAGRWYLATEYVHGEDLGRVIARVRRTDDQVPISLVTAIGAAIAAGLHHAHTHKGSRRTWRGSVHGGVSPSSILLGYDGSVKLAELGVAEPEASYLAPEQVTGGRIDRRTDVFALGVVLYELATARRLFKAPIDYLTKAAIAEPNIPAPSRFRRGLPRALENIILKALAPSPVDRFRSAGEMRAALDAFARGIGMRPSPPAIADYLKKLFGVRPLPWALAAQPHLAREALAERELDLDDDDLLGVAAPPESALRALGIPEARELEATPDRGTKTPMSWTSQPSEPQPWSRGKLGLMAGAAVIAGLLSFIMVSAVQRGGGAAAEGVRPAAAPPPPPPASPELAPLPPPPPSTEVLPAVPATAPAPIEGRPEVERATAPVKLPARSGPLRPKTRRVPASRRISTVS